MTSAAEATWSWNEAPFSTKLDPKRFFPGISQEESLSRLHFLVENHRRLGVLTGPQGSGKSMLLEVVAKQFRQQNRQVVMQSVMGVDLDEFLWKLAADLGTNPPMHAPPRSLWRDIDDVLAANRYQRIGTVMLFDDVEEAETDVITAIVRLAQSDASDESRLTIICGCDEDRLHLLGARLQDLCDLKIELEPWAEEEVQDFVRSSLTSAACSPDLFTDGSIRRIAELSGGIPRRLQQLAQLSLVAAAAQDLSEIDESTLNAVERELSAASW